VKLLDEYRDPELARRLLGRVTMRTLLGAHLVVDMLVGEQLPRIC